MCIGAPLIFCTDQRSFASGAEHTILFTETLEIASATAALPTAASPSAASPSTLPSVAAMNATPVNQGGTNAATTIYQSPESFPASPSTLSTSIESSSLTYSFDESPSSTSSSAESGSQSTPATAPTPTAFSESTKVGIGIGIPVGAIALAALVLGLLYRYVKHTKGSRLTHAKNIAAVEKRDEKEFKEDAVLDRFEGHNAQKDGLLGIGVGEPVRAIELCTEPLRVVISEIEGSLAAKRIELA